MARSKVFLAKALLLTAALAAVASGALNDQAMEVKQSMIDAEKIIKSYEFTQMYRQEVNFSNSSSVIRTSATSDTIGAFNLTALRGYTSTHSTRDDKNGSIREYFINGSLYENVNGRWTRIDIQDPVVAMGSFDDLRSTVELMDASNITSIQTESLDGQEYYRIDFVPDRRYVRHFLMSQMAAALSLASTDLPRGFLRGMELGNTTVLLSKSNLSWTAWIEKESGVLRRAETKVSFDSNHEAVKRPSEGAQEDLSIDASIVLTKSYGGFNEPIEILLPEEAKSAAPFSVRAGNSTASSR